MQFIRNLLNYFFTKSPGPEFRFYIPMIALIAILLVGAVVFSHYYKKKRREDIALKKLFKKLSSRLVTIAIILALLTVFRFESIPYFSMRIWMYLTFALAAFWGYQYIQAYRVKYPEMKQIHKIRPKKKKEKQRTYTASKKRR